MIPNLTRIDPSEVKGTLTNNLVATTETIVARFPLPANFFAAGENAFLSWAGQVSGAATLAFKVRLGALGTVVDPLIATFTTSAAGVANQYVFGDVLVSCLSATTAHAVGQISLGAASLPNLAAAFAAATIAPGSALFLSVTLVQSIAQTYTSRAAALIKD